MSSMLVGRQNANGFAFSDRMQNVNVGVWFSGSSHHLVFECCR